MAEIDLTKVSETELIELNRQIVARLRALHQSKTYQALAQFDLGEKVWFRGNGGERIEGLVIRVNKKTVSIRNGDHSHWNVSPNLLHKCRNQEPAAKMDNVVTLLRKH